MQHDIKCPTCGCDSLVIAGGTTEPVNQNRWGNSAFNAGNIVHPYSGYCKNCFTQYGDPEVRTILHNIQSQPPEPSTWSGDPISIKFCVTCGENITSLDTNVNGTYCYKCDHVILLLENLKVPSEYTVELIKYFNKLK